MNLPCRCCTRPEAFRPATMPRTTRALCVPPMLPSPADATTTCGTPHAATALLAAIWWGSGDQEQEVPRLLVSEEHPSQGCLTKDTLPLTERRACAPRLLKTDPRSGETHDLELVHPTHLNSPPPASFFGRRVLFRSCEKAGRARSTRPRESIGLSSVLRNSHDGDDTLHPAPDINTARRRRFPGTLVSVRAFARKRGSSPARFASALRGWCAVNRGHLPQPCSKPFRRTSVS